MARRLVIEVLSDASKFDDGINKADRSLRGFEGSTKRADSTTAKFTGRLDAAAVALKGIAFAAAGAALTKFVADSVRAASDLSESINAVEQTFESASDTVLAFSEQSARAVGLSARAFNELVTPIGALLRNFGFDAQSAADASIELATRAADLASVFNVDVAQALGAIQAALRGEGDPIERFGANVSAARVEAFALAEGLASTKGEIDDAVKVQARLGLVLQDTARFAGDFADTSDGAANATKILRAEVEDLQASVGEQLLEPLAIGLNVLSDSIITVRQFGNALSNFFNKSERDAGEAKIAVDELRNAIGDLSANSLASFATLIAGTQDDFEGASDEAAEFRDEMNVLGEETEITKDMLEEFAEATGLAAADIDDLLSRSVEDLAEKLGLPVDVVERLIPLLQELRGELQIQQGIDAYAARMQGIANAYLGIESAASGAAGENERLAGSFLSVLQARRELVSPLFAAAQSQERLASARGRLAELEGDSEASADDLARAQLDVVSAQAEAQVATEEFARGFQDSFQAALDISQELDRELLVGLLQTLGLLNDLAPIDLFTVLGLGQAGFGAIAPQDNVADFFDRGGLPSSTSGVTNNVDVTINSSTGDAREIANATTRAISESLERYNAGVVGQ